MKNHCFSCNSSVFELCWLKGSLLLKFYDLVFVSFFFRHGKCRRRTVTWPFFQKKNPSTIGIVVQFLVVNCQNSWFSSVNFGWAFDQETQIFYLLKSVHPFTQVSNVWWKDDLEQVHGPPVLFQILWCIATYQWPSCSHVILLQGIAVFHRKYRCTIAIFEIKQILFNIFVSYFCYIFTHLTSPSTFTQQPTSSVKDPFSHIWARPPTDQPSPKPQRTAFLIKTSQNQPTGKNRGWMPQDSTRASRAQ